MTSILKTQSINTLLNFLRKANNLIVVSHSPNSDMRRRETIFNVLLIALLSLTGIAFLYMLINVISKGTDYQGAPIYTLIAPIIVLIGMYALSRYSFHNWLVYVFISVYVVLGSLALILYGYASPEGLLTYAVVIVISGILISSRAAVYTILVVMTLLAIISFLQLHGISRPDDSELAAPLLPGHNVIYMLFFLIIFLVSWLSTRDIEKSLQRAKLSEEALINEKKSLEIRVKERTRELEQSQVEKMIELQRFAEFGELSSTLMHDLSNPLTSVAIELDQISSKDHANSIKNARRGIYIMEQYIRLARERLSAQGEIKLFSLKHQLELVVGYFQHKADLANIEIQINVLSRYELRGDSIRFNQFMANLISNAIDSYDGFAVKQKTVVVDVRRRTNSYEILVQDHGKGITNPMQKKVFEAFYTSKSSDKGSGLGLLIAKRTIENYFGGNISVISEIDKGTVFRIILPINAIKKAL